MANVFKPKISRTLVGGETREYESNVWHCRFYALGRVFRYSTGLEDKDEALRRCEEWRAQVQAGEDMDPPPPGARRSPLPLKKVELSGLPPEPEADNHGLLSYIRWRRRLGVEAETILNEVEQALSSGSAGH